MTERDSVVAIYDTHEQAEQAVKSSRGRGRHEEPFDCSKGPAHR
jgi:hypothetical protein